jgi:hypothetical protein
MITTKSVKFVGNNSMESVLLTPIFGLGRLSNKLFLLVSMFQL